MKKEKVFKSLVIISLVLLSVLLFSFSVSAYECTPSRCPSGYEDRGINCEVHGLNYECKRECYRPGRCGTYGGIQSKSSTYSVGPSDKNKNFGAPRVTQNSNYCYKYQGEASLSVSDWDPSIWHYEAESVELYSFFGSGAYASSSCSSGQKDVSVRSKIKPIGRGVSGSGFGSIAKFIPYLNSYCGGGKAYGISGTLTVKTLYSMALWIKTDTQYKTCSGTWDCLSGDTKCEGKDSYSCRNHEWVKEGKIVGECGVECTSGDKCEGMDYIKCENYEWVNKGKVKGKCGVECETGYKCEDKILMKCTNYKWKTWETCSYKCENGKCIADPCEGVTCSDKCENSVRYYDGYCSEGECNYQTETCDYGCSGKFCAEDPCKGVTCDDKCENSIWYHDGHCVDGNCVYDSEDTCKYGCQNEPSPFLAVVVGEGMCRTTPCEGIICDDYCSETTLFYDGKCVGGKCVQFKEKPYAEECGAVPWYKNTWVWVGGITFIIVVIFSFMYYQRRFKR